MQSNAEQCWLALKFVPRLPVSKKIELAERFGICELFRQSPDILADCDLNASQLKAIVKPNWQKIQQIIDDSAQCHSQLLLFDDDEYPQLLKQIYDPPLVLFVRGNKALLNKAQVAIVGSRSASIYGKETTLMLAKQLAEQGIVITSGLAIGIDAWAHKGALCRDNSTIAVVATGLDQVYPARNKPLFREIIDQGGTVISEFPPKTMVRPGHFPKRNRIISGLSKGVVIVEAALQSGSLITARCALEQNREVFAVPGSIHHPLSKGCHWLIKQGAKLIEQSADIIDELAITPCVGSKIKCDENCEKNESEDLFLDPLLASVGYEATPVDIVVSRSELPTEEVLTRLTMLELRGLVSAVPGGYLRLNRG